MKEKTKYRITVLLLAMTFFGIRWASGLLKKDIKIDQINKSEKSISWEAKQAKIKNAIADYDDVSTICIAAMIFCACGSAGYYYFDRRERNNEK